VLWWLGLTVETVACLGLRAVQRHVDAGRRRTSFARRVYAALLGVLATRGRARQLADPALPLERQELRRRTGWLTFGLMIAAIAPMVAVVLIEASRLNPVLAQLVAWGILCASPALTSAPARMIATLVGLGRGWVGPGGTSPDSHEYPLAG
jgi:hypothetical protein